jgi:hypothetical protein
MSDLPETKKPLVYTDTKNYNDTIWSLVRNNRQAFWCGDFLDAVERQHE